MTIISEIMKLPTQIEPISGQKFSYVKLGDVLAIFETTARDHAPCTLEPIDDGAPHDDADLSMWCLGNPKEAAAAIRKLRAARQSAAIAAEPVAGTIADLAEKLCVQFDGQEDAYFSLNEGEKKRWRKVARLAAKLAAPTTSPEPDVVRELERVLREVRRALDPALDPTALPFPTLLVQVNRALQISDNARVLARNDRLPPQPDTDRCDCENPEPASGVALVSEDCPIHGRSDA